MSGPRPNPPPATARATPRRAGNPVTTPTPRPARRQPAGHSTPPKPAAQGPAQPAARMPGPAHAARQSATAPRRVQGQPDPDTALPTLHSAPAKAVTRTPGPARPQQWATTSPTPEPAAQGPARLAGECAQGDPAAWASGPPLMLRHTAVERRALRRNPPPEMRRVLPGRAHGPDLSHRHPALPFDLPTLHRGRCRAAGCAGARGLARGVAGCDHRGA